MDISFETAAEGMHGDNKPLQLFEFIKNDKDEGTTIKLREDTMTHLINRAGGRPLAIFCICGPFQQGNSRTLGYIVRCLEAMEKGETDWMDKENKEKPLKGFEFWNGKTPETQGMWVWSRPFIVKKGDDKEVAVVLLESQGNPTDTKDMSAIVGLSLLTSSVMILNCFSDLPEDFLSTLSTYNPYGELALDNVNDKTPFEKLIFLIQNGDTPGEHAFGGGGGKEFLEEKLKIKDGQSPEARQVRENIKKYFQELECFLLPTIGDKALLPDCDGAVASLSPDFAQKMEEFINNSISREKLAVKEILGEVVTAEELKKFLDKYVEILNSNEVPSAQSLWEATSDVHNNHIVKRACKLFSELMKNTMDGDNYLLVDALKEIESAAEKQAVEYFEKSRKFGSPEKMAEYQEQLEGKLQKNREQMRKQNEEKRSKYITGVFNDALTKFRTSLETAISFDDKDPMFFYEESEINREASQIKDIVMAELKEKMEHECEDMIAKKNKSLEAIVEASLSSLLSRNNARRAEVVRKILDVGEQVRVKLEGEMKDFLRENQFAADHEFKLAQKYIMASSLDVWKNGKKPGSTEFQNEHFFRLKNELECISSQFEHEHKRKMEAYKMESDKWIAEACKEFKKQQSELAEEIVMEEEETQKQLDEGSINKVLERFSQQGNPYPIGHSMHKQQQDKLEAELENIFERVKREMADSLQRSEESCREAVEESLRYYEFEMNGALASTDFMSDEDIKEQHAQLLWKAFEIFDKTENLGSPSMVREHKDVLVELMKSKFCAMEEKNHQKRELALSKAKNCVNDCRGKYVELMKNGMHTVRNTEQMDALHKRAETEALRKFRESCPLKGELMEDYEESLRGEIEDTFEELKELVEMRQAEESVALKGILHDCRTFYHDEMGKHCKNTFFIHPTELEAHHKQALQVVLDKCADMIPLTAFQKIDLEQEMETLYKKYVSKNDMKLNSAGGAPPAIGVDLGTTYSCVSVHLNGKVIVIPNHEQENSETTASYVTFNADGSKTIGNVAKDNAYENPENTIYDAKRIHGRRMDDPELQEDIKFWPFEVVEDEGVPKINVNGKLLFPQQVSAELLSHLRSMAERHLKLAPGAITKAVITVPAYFNDGQRQATIDAGHLAGLEVLTILNEPTAAAIAYYMERLDTSPRKVLIFDLGGGTFDVSILNVSPGSIEVVGVDGDTHLGGEDFDKEMMKHCALMFKEAVGKDLMEGKDSPNKKERDEARRRMRRLQTYCEKAKKGLSSGRITTVSIDAMYEGLDLKVDVTREKFEELNESRFKTAIDILQRALLKTGTKKEEIDDIVLVGGSTRIPRVRKMLGKVFGKNKALNYSIHADQAVAYGAAVKAAMMNGEQARGKIDFERIDDVTPLSLGIEVQNKEDRSGPGLLSVIIPKNTKVPCRMKEVYVTADDNQTSGKVKIYQGEERVASQNELLGSFVLEGIPPAKAGEESADVWMEIDAMGILHVEAVCNSTQGRKKITVRENRLGMSKETKKKLLADVNPAA